MLFEITIIYEYLICDTMERVCIALFIERGSNNTGRHELCN
jgi:hypothetical protein